MNTYYLGVDLGAESVRIVEVEKQGEQLHVLQQLHATHNKDPQGALVSLLSNVDLGRLNGMAVTGRLQRIVNADGVPSKAAMRRGVRLLHPELPSATIISVGGHGFSTLEVNGKGEDWYQQNGRCSQGTGNFLNQLVNRFGLTVQQASELCDPVDNPAPLSGRCPVILKTDMTHLANKGEDKARILAGLYDAVCENVLTLVRPRLAPKDVILIGGVTQANRVRRNIGKWLDDRGLRLVPLRKEHLFLEAFGAASHAMEHPCQVPDIDHVIKKSAATQLERVPALRGALDNVKRVKRVEFGKWEGVRDVVFGFDIGSTGSKAVAVDVRTKQTVWESYLNTEGSPINAAQRLVKNWVNEIGSQGRIRGFGVTGSGREIVGSLLRTSYGDGRIFVMNEIAAHAQGAVAIDPQVDTIFEIGGQDAKYIRLEGGRVIDAAMNEACSAGTGSFIAEQGLKFEGIGENVVKLGDIALEADHGISLGQHCSVFMAEVIDEAITQGEAQEAIIAGLYDSIIQNYLNRVKGPRSVGDHIFCQGMPFASDALAAAVARQTGRSVVVPPNPGTIGAFGIALLAHAELSAAQDDSINGEEMAPDVFLGTNLLKKETFICKSTKGCGEPGNRCRIDRLTTEVKGVKQKFIWGGNCSLYDKGAGRGKLPDLSPDPFHDREKLLDDVLREAQRDPGSAPIVAMTDEFALKGLAPLFATFIHNLGFDCQVKRHADGKTLHRGIEGARVPYCAPMQMFHGVMFDIADTEPDYILLPMLQGLPSVEKERHSVLCPVVQASPDLVGNLLTQTISKNKLLKPIIAFDTDGYDGKRFWDSMRQIAKDLDAEYRFEKAMHIAVATQKKFDEDIIDIGRRALAFAKENNVVPVAVLGRPYTIYNDVLNSNVPNILRSLGSLAIPVDCLPIDEDISLYTDQYWAYTQRNLRAAEYVRKTPGLYSVFCSNYACGPDSFTLHFYSYIMQGKPFAIVETDGHSGDAGTKTRMEAFLYVTDTDLRSQASTHNKIYNLKEVEDDKRSLTSVRRDNATLLVPRMGAGADVASAALRGEGFRAETLGMPDREDVRIGRKYTSGKECVPMMITTGSLLKRIEQEKDTDEKFSFMMPTASGPCRFGVYNVLHKIIIEKTGWSDRVGIFSPDDDDYFREVSAEFELKLWSGFVAHDLVEAMLYDVRPVERRKGQANGIYQRYRKEIIEAMEKKTAGTAFNATKEVATGRLWGMRDILKDAAKEFAAVKNPVLDVPTVAVVGEIYVRSDPFANDFIIDKLEERGIRVRFAPFVEWLEYSQHLAERRVLDKDMAPDDNPLSIGVSGLLQRSTLEAMYTICADTLGWGGRSHVPEILETARPYIRPDLTGEVCLTIGGPILEFKENLVQGVVIVGPHECMPNRIAEAQYGQASEEMNIPYLSLSLNGDPLDTEALDRFAYDIHELYRQGLGKDFNMVMERNGDKGPRLPDVSDSQHVIVVKEADGTRKLINQRSTAAE